MEYLTAEQAAKKMAMRLDIVRAICQSGWFGRKFSDVWLITDKEIEAYWDGRRIPQDELPPLYDAGYVIEEMGISRSMFFRLLANGAIESETFGLRGGKPNLLFTQKQLDSARALTKDLRIMGHTTTPFDKYIEQRNGRFHVRGTLNAQGVERNYKTIYMARRTARKAYDNPPIFQKGLKIPFGDQYIEFLKDVLEVDHLAYIRIGSADTYYAVRQILDYAQEKVAN